MNFKDLILAARYLKKFRKYSIINIFGLALGMACAMIIILWVNHELRVDKFHTNGKNIYVIRKMTRYSDGQTGIDVSMSAYTAPEIKKELPEIEQAVRVTWRNDLLFRLDEKMIYEGGHYADSNFFKVFSYPLLSGNPENVLKEPNSITISEKVAMTFFGNIDVVGKTINIRANKEETYTITGVFQNISKLSSFQFDYILPFSKYEEYNKSWFNWGSHHLMSFVQVKPNSDIKKLGEKITEVYLKNSPWKLPVLFIRPYEDMHLYGQYENSIENPSGLILYIRIFSAVALFIIILACMNYTNLATAIATKRAREVGVKKVFGSGTKMLLKQFTLEAMTLTFFGFLFSLVLVRLSLPYINTLLDSELKLNFSDLRLILMFLSVPVLTSVLAGTFPAIYLSAFKPIEALKNLQSPKKGAFNLRQSLVVFQFVITIIFIISSLLILKQIKFIQNKSLGLDKDDVISFLQSIKISEHRDVFKQELEKQPGVISVSYSSDSPLDIGSDTSDPKWKGKNTNDNFSIPYIRVDYDFCKTFNVNVVKGRDFSVKNPSDKNGILINQRFASLMGFENPIGEIVDYWGRKAEILGVVGDFHIGNMHRPIQQLMIICRPEETWQVNLKIDGKQRKEALANIQKAFYEFDNSVPFEYEFISDQFNKEHETEKYLGRFSNLFTSIAIIISCLGLFGLALFTTEQKTKELGIRKSIGAKTSELVFMVAEGFIKWIIIAFLIACLVAYYIMQSWLQTFAFRTEIDWWVFILTGLIAIVIGLTTFSWQTWHAARRNPVEALRYE